MNLFSKYKRKEFKNYWHEYAAHWFFFGFSVGVLLIVSALVISVSMFGLCAI